MKKILVVCLGNICRSPAGEGVLRSELINNGKIESKDFVIESAGTSSWHIGDNPDYRSVKVCKKYGIDISNHRARKVIPEEGKEFDLILGMDNSNIKDLKEIVSQKYHDKIFLFDDVEIKDPYYGEETDFQKMFEHIKRASMKWVLKILK